MRDEQCAMSGVVKPRTANREPRTANLVFNPSIFRADVYMSLFRVKRM